ncbi:MAG: TauD/TfdA family dioxygenase [Acidimicrobiia bacterium]
MTSAPSIAVRTLPGAFGAVAVEGVRPADAADAATVAMLRELLAQQAVVCLRQPAPLDDGEARAIASMIGPIKDPVGRTRDGGTLRYSEDRQIIDAGFVLTDELRAELGELSFGGLDSDRPGLFETFHTDDTYTECPAAATVLHARDLPPSPGGPTHFLDMRAAYASLEPELRARLIGLRAACSYNNRGVFAGRAAAEGPFEQLVDVSHPIVRSHPVTRGPSLYIDLDRATHVEGMSETEGRALLQLLQDHAEAHAPRYAHSWQTHDVLVWDNASVQHKAGGDFPVGEPRRFWRFMIEGPVPAAYTEP